MKPEDKHGNDIYPDTYQQLLQQGAQLEDAGYRESSNKPNLFYKNDKVVTIFADMRGTNVVNIWDDTRPMIYWNFDKKMPDWAKRRVLKQEVSELEDRGIDYRTSFHQGRGQDQVRRPLRGTDGYCVACGKDMGKAQSYCSEDCKEQYRRKKMPEIFCNICDADTSKCGSVNHHVSYFPEETVRICRSCHRKLHLNESVHPELTPPQEEIDRFYSNSTAEDKTARHS